MAVLTQTFLLECESAEEFSLFVAQLDTYQANPASPPLTQREDDQGALIIRYTAITAVLPSG